MARLPIHTDLIDKLLTQLLKLPWFDVLTEAWQQLRKLMGSRAEEGMYEVLEYESRLELKDGKGRRAHFSKREKVRYLQDHIIAYQDHAWGDGEILLNYRCTPGVIVDRYRPGQKTFLLISLREEKKRGDMDEFHIEWDIRDGFVRDYELWETEVRQQTRRLKVQIVFPKSRPPLRVWVKEAAGGRRYEVDDPVQLPNGRFLVTWQLQNPTRNQRFQLHWHW